MKWIFTDTTNIFDPIFFNIFLHLSNYVNYDAKIHPLFIFYSIFNSNFHFNFKLVKYKWLQLKMSVVWKYLHILDSFISEFQWDAYTPNTITFYSTRGLYPVRRGIWPYYPASLWKIKCHPNLYLENRIFLMFEIFFRKMVKNWKYRYLSEIDIYKIRF